MSLPYPSDSDHNVLVPASGEVRKTVTVLFSDVADSTPLGEALDPESTRAVMSRYFDAVQAVAPKLPPLVRNRLDALAALLRAVLAAEDLIDDIVRFVNGFDPSALQVQFRYDWRPAIHSWPTASPDAFKVACGYAAHSLSKTGVLAASTAFPGPGGASPHPSRMTRATSG